MLDATEEYGNVDERQAAASSRKEGSPVEAAAVETDHVCNRMVYKLVKVRDDGSVLAATEDDVFQFLVGGPEIRGLASYDPEAGSDAIGEEEDDAGSEYVASDGEDLSCSTSRPKSIPIQDLAVERQRLKAQIEVLDCILMRVDLEERRRLSAEKETVGKMGNPGPTYVNTSGVGTGDSYKRQRRPNPKYFDAVYDPGDSDSTLIGPPPTSNSEQQPMPTRQAISSARKAQQHPRSTTTDVIVNSPRRVTSGWGSARHRPRSSSLKPSFTRIPTKVNHDINNTCVSSLDNLSIRELHEAFCSTYGRETSVKDKHWLKRQISAGWRRQEQENHDVGQFIRSTITTTDHQNKLKARLDSCVTQQAEQPLQTVTPASNPRDQVANDVDQEANDHVEHDFSDHAFRSRLGSRCFHRRVTTPAILSTSCIYGEVVNNGEPVVEGKRQRKPNRRYIEDEAYVVSGFVPVHETRSFFSGETHHELGNSATNYSWRTVPETDGSSEIIARHTRAGSQKFSPIQRPKLISSGIKRKVGGRAAKLVMMAHTSVARVDSDAAKLIHLPTTPGDIITENGNIMAEMNGDSAAGSDLPGSAIMQKQLDQLPENMDESGDDAQPTGLVLDSKTRSGGVDQVIASGEPDSGQQQVVVKTTPTVSTVPTASGGTRRKHHRPWTLREVMTLVEGVARCGGGKWADIKKLAFSTVAYRTAVDLKDKWRNLLRASRAQHHPAKQGERKKQFTAAIPAPILSRVRELASLPNQFPSATVTSVSCTSRSGRNIVHRK